MSKCSYTDVLQLSNGVAMLLLARKVGQSIVIGDDIKITIMDINGSQIRLSVSAPKGVVINSDETQIKEQAEERARQQIEES